MIAADEPEAHALGRATAVIAVGAAAARGLGFVRAVVMAGVLGAVAFGDTYMRANYVPNILFELVAAGALSAVLVPALVERLVAQRDRRDAEELAGATLGIVGGGLAVVAILGAVLAPLLMRALTVVVPAGADREDQIRLGTVFLWCFLPQLVLYAWAMVATAALHAQRRFLAPSLAPAASSLVVIGVFAVYAAMASASRSLDPPVSHVLVLGLGTTAGVLALAAVPAIALARSGFSLRPRFDVRQPGLAVLRKVGLWAAISLAATQVLGLGAIVVGGAVEGGVVVWQLAFTFFLVPHALLSQPIFTALFPRLSELAAGGEAARQRETVAAGLRATAFVVLPATAAYVILARPLLEAVRFSRLEGASLTRAADALAVLAVGLLAYGAVQLATRSCYARGDGRTAGVATATIAVVGLAGMAVFAALLPTGHVVTGVAAGHTLAYCLGAAILLRHERTLRPAAVAMLVAAGAATIAGVAAALVRNGVGGDGRVGAVADVLAGGAVLAGVYVAIQAARRAPELGQLRRLLRTGTA